MPLTIKVAICNDAQVYNSNRIFKKTLAKKFPGTLWMPILAQSLKEIGIEVITGDIAISKIESGKWKSNRVLIVQELAAKDGKKLISLGANPFILTGYESPLYAYRFYDNLANIARKFKNRILYKGAFKNLRTSEDHNHTLFFPSFTKDDIISAKDWTTRKFIVMVISNKYWKEPFRIPLFKNLKVYPAWLSEELHRIQSPTRSMAVRNELLTKRLESIEYFGNLRLLDLYGKGWENTNNLPTHWQKRLKRTLENLNPKPIRNKITTIASYKFAICFENVSYPGHITEKIIDCFVAGVIPIYLGAPDIGDFIPKNTFIDARNFNSLKHVDRFIHSITEKKALEFIAHGQNFLRSKRGQQFSFEGVANSIFNMIFSRTGQSNSKST